MHRDASIETVKVFKDIEEPMKKLSKINNIRIKNSNNRNMLKVASNSDLFYELDYGRDDLK